LLSPHCIIQRGAGHWNKKLTSVFLPVFQIVEISLRNTIHQSYFFEQEAESYGGFSGHIFVKIKKGLIEALIKYNYFLQLLCGI